MFVLTICAQGRTAIVSIVCVRAEACVWPLYMVSMWADRPSTSSEDRTSRTESVTVLLEASSSTVLGKVALEDLSSYLSVPPGTGLSTCFAKKRSHWVSPFASARRMILIRVLLRTSS